MMNFRLAPTSRFGSEEVGEMPSRSGLFQSRLGLGRRFLIACCRFSQILGPIKSYVSPPFTCKPSPSRYTPC